MPEFTDEQLRYHAAKAGFPANVMAAELLRVRGVVEDYRVRLPGDQPGKYWEGYRDAIRDIAADMEVMSAD